MNFTPTATPTGCVLPGAPAMALTAPAGRGLPALPAPIWKTALLLLAILLAVLLPMPQARAATLTTLVEFNNTSAPKGASPLGSLVQGTDGNFYGMTSSGGASSNGTAFKLTPAGVLTTLVEFNNTTAPKGRIPVGNLVQGSDWNFYGMTRGGGASSNGTVFKMTPAGALTTLVEFNDTAPKGSNPRGSLVQGTDGNFYGMTFYGGVENYHGTAFQMTPAGVLTTLVEFNSLAAPKGSRPYGSLVQGTDGNFYGMTSSGGANNGGTAFKLTPAGVLTTLVEFNYTTPPKGAIPLGSLVQGTDGNFYGMTLSGGTNYYGTVFKMTPAGVLTTLVEFNNTSAPKGASPLGSLVQGTDGNFYGMTSSGGASSNGTVFKMTPAGVLTTLVEFNDTTAPKGSGPFGSLVQGTDGNFYGMTSHGGASSNGTVFKLDVSGPEIEVQQPAGTDIADGGSKSVGIVDVGAIADLNFTIKNHGNVSLTGLGITIDGTDSNLFTVIASPTATVTAAGSTTFTVRFAPTSAGAKTAVLHIASNDADENPYDITLTGTGVIPPAPEIAVEQPVGTGIADGGSKSFGSVSVEASADIIFTIKNTGDTNLTGLTITKDGTDSAMFTVTASPTAPVSGPSGSTTFTVRFAPTSAGAKTAVLHIASNDADENPYDITLTGTGTTVLPPAPEIAVEQPVGTGIADGGSKSFGSVSVEASADIIFTIKNTGDTNLTGLTITKDGTDSAMFTVTASPTAPVSGPSGSTTFTVRFAPTSTGAKTAALHIANNDADENPYDITLTGTGTGLVAYYPFNGNANDASGNGNNGTVNGATLTSDRFGNGNSAYYFSGLTNYIATPVYQENVTKYTIAGWIKTTQGGVIVGNNLNNQHFVLNIHTTQSGGAGKGQVVWGVQTEGISVGVQSTARFDDGIWHHIVGVFDGVSGSASYDQFKLYVDGVIQTSFYPMSSGSVSVPVNSNTIRIGQDQKWVENLGGAVAASSIGNLDDIRIYDRALSSNEVAQLYAIEAVPLSVIIQRTGGNVVLTWPSASAQGFALQGNADVGLSNSWATVGPSAVSNLGYYSVTLPLTNTNRFFRLQKP